MLKLTAYTNDPHFSISPKTYEATKLSHIIQALKIPYLDKLEIDNSQKELVLIIDPDKEFYQKEVVEKRLKHISWKGVDDKTYLILFQISNKTSTESIFVFTSAKEFVSWNKFGNLYNAMKEIKTTKDLNEVDQKIKQKSAEVKAELCEAVKIPNVNLSPFASNFLKSNKDDEKGFVRVMSELKNKKLSFDEIVKVWFHYKNKNLTEHQISIIK